MSSAAQLPPAEYEPRDAFAGTIVWTGAGLAAGLAIVLAISALLYAGFHRRQAVAHDGGRETSFRNGAQARMDIEADWARQDAAVHEHLETYGWVDRRAGTTHIPIDRAMQLMLDENRGEKKEAKP